MLLIGEFAPASLRLACWLAPAIAVTPVAPLVRPSRRDRLLIGSLPVVSIPPVAIAPSRGNHRIWLYSLEGTNTFGRDGFSLHGGKFLGSAGCVDLGYGIDSFIDQYKKNGRDLTLKVQY